jgi:hypothetical protein
MTMPTLYHILYADEMRLDSLDAQLHGVVPVSLTKEESESKNKDIGGEVGMPSVASGHRNVTLTTGNSASTQYAFRDARYFEVLEKIGIDLQTPHTSLSFEPDGQIHAFSGKLQIVSLSTSKPLVETAKIMFSAMRKDPETFGIKPEKGHTKSISGLEAVADVILRIPAPPAFRLSMKSGESLYGPVIESAVRLPLIDQTIVFGSALPFEWIIVGYLYPLETEIAVDQSSGFLFQISSALENMRMLINPKAHATLIPLLILR